MSFWHSATFNNDGTKLLFSDEWGGGGQPRCRATDKKEWGTDALFTIENNKLKFHSYYKLPAPQTSLENCVAHNGSLIPIPGRDVMVQAWYQGGLSVFDWTDIDHPKEIAFFDRGPVDAERMVMGGSWSAVLVQRRHRQLRDRARNGLYELAAERLITENEIAAAKTVRMPYLEHAGSAEDRLAAELRRRARYLDQLERSKGLAAETLRRRGRALASAERASGNATAAALTALASQLTNRGARIARDQAKVQILATAVTDLANASAEPGPSRICTRGEGEHGSIRDARRGRAAPTARLGGGSGVSSQDGVDRLDLVAGHGVAHTRVDALVHCGVQAAKYCRRFVDALERDVRIRRRCRPREQWCVVERALVVPRRAGRADQPAAQAEHAGVPGRVTGGVFERQACALRKAKQAQSVAIRRRLSSRRRPTGDDAERRTEARLVLRASARGTNRDYQAWPAACGAK